jgi:catechol 2,3-dioxygenase-like lactoylglutathione lyase family enzyme
MAYLSAATKGEDREFSSAIVDIGVVVQDIEKSVKFYTESIGFKELPGFSVPADFARDSGLTDNQPLDIRVLVLGEGENATKLKLMHLPGVTSKTSDNQFIHSQFGLRYLTVFVSDMNAALKRLEKTDVKPVGKPAVPLPPPLAQGVHLTLVRDPDGNLIELIGPNK